MNFIAGEENYLIIESEYTVNTQGLIITFSLSVDYDEIVTLAMMADKMMEFILDKFKDFFKKNEMLPKFESPIIVSDNEKLKIIMCYVGKPTDELKNNVKKLNIEEKVYV